MNTAIPTEIQSVIKAERKRQADQERERKLDADVKRQSRIKQGVEALSTYLMDVIQLLPDWAQGYAKMDKYDEEELERIGNYGLRDGAANLEIPGLSPISVVKEGSKLKYMVPDVSHGDVFDKEAPHYLWGNSRTDLYDLERAIELASRSEDLLKQCTQEFEREMTSRAASKAAREEQELLINEEVSERRLQEGARKLDEVEKLLAALRNDPVAVHMMKAFLAVRQERSMYEERISDADDTMCSMEERWSQRAADLRREADDAERRAKEERDRASDIESELDDVKRKAKRGF